MNNAVKAIENDLRFVRQHVEEYKLKSEGRVWYKPWQWAEKRKASRQMFYWMGQMDALTRALRWVGQEPRVRKLIAAEKSKVNTQ